MQGCIYSSKLRELGTLHRSLENSLSISKTLPYGNGGSQCRGDKTYHYHGSPQRSRKLKSFKLRRVGRSHYLCRKDHFRGGRRPSDFLPCHCLRFLPSVLTG